MLRWIGKILSGEAVLFVVLFLAVAGFGLIVFFATRGDPITIAPPPEPLPTFRLTVLDQGTVIRIEGAIDLGITAALSEVLDGQDDVLKLELQSGGGRVPEARGLIRLVTEHDLATVARGDCLSACTLVFMAGKTRTLGQGARLGFHSYALRSPVVAALTDVSALQARDMERFLALGIDGAFLDRIAETPPEGMWFPSRHALIAAGVVTEP